jgi:endogenous inhibitor of DNA gyrase (YacG/DUF329 family)
MAAQSMAAQCPICREKARPREHNVAFPFCSPRCKLADLQKWLGGGYAVPGEPVLADDRQEDGS